VSGLKYRDTTVSTSNNNPGTISSKGPPEKITDDTAPDATKKKPAYAHSFTSGYLGTIIAITHNIFHTPRIMEKYAGYHKKAILSTSISSWSS
jgi:hypothetical protein